MTAEEFLFYINKYYQGGDKGKARLNRQRRLYAAYVAAYREPSLEKLISMYFERPTMNAVRAACRDRDAGRPMVDVPELL